MTAAELLSFLREHSRVVQASVSRFGSAQAAAVGVIVTDDFEIFFDSAGESRKVENLRRSPRIAFVIGGTAAGDERTVQYEGKMKRRGRQEGRRASFKKAYVTLKKGEPMIDYAEAI